MRAGCQGQRGREGQSPFLPDQLINIDDAKRPTLVKATPQCERL